MTTLIRHDVGGGACTSTCRAPLLSFSDGSGLHSEGPVPAIPDPVEKKLPGGGPGGSSLHTLTPAHTQGGGVLSSTVQDRLAGASVPSLGSEGKGALKQAELIVSRSAGTEASSSTAAKREEPFPEEERDAEVCDPGG